MIEFSDVEILDCLKRRKGYVVQYLYDRYLPMIRLMVHNLGGDPEDAEDIFQDGLETMMIKLDSKKFELTCKFKTYFYYICEYKWKSILVKRKVEGKYLQSIVSQSCESDYTENSDQKLFYSIFKRGFEKLDDVGKKILELWWKKTSFSDIAVQLGYTYGYVRKKKSISQKELIKRIKEDPDFKSIDRERNLFG